MGGNETDDDPQAPAMATDYEAEGSGAAGIPSQHMQVSTNPPHQRRLDHAVTHPILQFGCFRGISSLMISLAIFTLQAEVGALS